MKHYLVGDLFETKKKLFFNSVLIYIPLFNW